MAATADWCDFSKAFPNQNKASDVGQHQNGSLFQQNFADLSALSSSVGLKPKEGASLHTIKTEKVEAGFGLSVTCPTCKSAVPLSPAIVLGMQEMQLGEDVHGTEGGAGVMSCDLCQEAGQEAKVLCTACHKFYCTRCRRPHDKLCKGKTGASPHEPPLLQRQKSEGGGLGDTLIMLEKLLQSLTEEAAWAEQLIDLTSEEPQSSLGFQQQQQLEGKGSSEEVGLKDDEDHHHHYPHHPPQLQDFRSRTGSDSAHSLPRSRRESESPQSPPRSRRESESVWSLALSRCDSVLSQTTAMSLTAILKKSLEKQMETERLVAGLQQQVSDLQQQNTLLFRDLADLQERQGRQDHEILRERDARTSLERELISMRDDITTLQNDANKVQDSVCGLQLARDTLEAVHKMSQQVAFHAILATKVRLHKRDVLVCEEVVSNVGGGYNPATGFFVAPVSGTYCFMATSSPGAEDEFAQCKLDLMVGERDVAFLSARGNNPCTTHAVVKVTAGHRAYLRANEDGKFAGGWRTSFTGTLVQPELQR